MERNNMENLKNVVKGGKFMVKKTKGITLIALIITVIVMLILVAVTVSVLINSNLIGTAQNAADATKQAYEQEGSFGNGEITIGGKQYESFEQYSQIVQNGSSSKVIRKEEAINTQLNNANVKEVVRTETTTKTYEAPIPVGFTVSKATGENSIADGLVIYEGDAEVNDSNVSTAKTTRNQFVWIPVEVNKTTAPVDTATSIASFRRSVWQDNERVANNVQSAISFPSSSSSWSNYTEPYSYDSSDYDGANGTGIATQIAELTESIYKYEGFYIGRYEAGVTGTTARTSSSSQTDSFVIQQDKYPYNYIKWGSSMSSVDSEGAVYLSNNLYARTNQNYGATSMLCTGVCWDSMLDFVKNNSYNVTSGTNWGNYTDSETYKVYRGSLCFNLTWSIANTTAGSDVTKDTKILLTTGATDRNCSKNIYDVAGNCYEWTTEAGYTDCRVLRSGGYGSESSKRPASGRSYASPTNCSYEYYSFRLVLYVK